MAFHHLLVASGLFLVYAEFFFPGGLFALFGTLLLLTAIVRFAVVASLLFLALFILLILLLTAGVAALALWQIQRSGADNSLQLVADQRGARSSHCHPQELQQQGKAVTDLRPVGYIEIAKKRLLARTEGVFLPCGSVVRVIANSGGIVIVEKVVG